MYYKKASKIVSVIFSCAVLTNTANVMAEIHAAHVHGNGELTIAIENNDIHLNFIAPSESLVGFEHQAQSQEEQSTVNRAKKILANPALLFTFTKGVCKAKDIDVDVNAIMPDEDKNADKGEHDHHGSEKHEHHHHEHRHDHDDAHKSHEKSEKHSEISATYHFACDNTAKITEISTSLFTHFSGLEVINSAWLSEKGQGASKLSHKQNKITLN